jgi:hypothetical protein
VRVVEGLSHDDFARQAIAKTTEELTGERSEVVELIS